jgi:hypothetical protein
MAVFAKDPTSDVDYSFDWAAWLADGETIISANWSVTPDSTDGLQLHSPTEGGAQRGIHVSGGTAGQRYRLSCRIETSVGRIGERSLTLRVMER